MSVTIEFGFLYKPVVVEIPGVRISPLPDHAESLAAIRKHVHQDGNLYPPEEERVSLPDWPDDTREEPVPNTRRPAHLFDLRPSHVLELEDPVSPNAADGDAAFLVQVLAYVYGTRLQPSGWQFDARVPISRPTHHVRVGQPALVRLLTRAYNEW